MPSVVHSTVCSEKLAISIHASPINAACMYSIHLPGAGCALTSIKCFASLPYKELNKCQLYFLKPEWVRSQFIVTIKPNFYARRGGRDGRMLSEAENKLNRKSKTIIRAIVAKQRNERGGQPRQDKTELPENCIKATSRAAAKLRKAQEM